MSTEKTTSKPKLSESLTRIAAAKPDANFAHVNLGARLAASPVVANGTLYVASVGGWLWAMSRR